MREVKLEKRITGRLANKEFSFMLFDQCEIMFARIKNCRFDNVHFKHTNMGPNSRYKDCEFNGCKFWGAYSTLGPAKYNNCKFIGCDFTGTMQFSSPVFFDCSFSGKITNAIIKGRSPGLFKKKKFVFNHCDLGDVIFDNLSLYGKFTFNNCILPRKGIRKFRNENDILIDRAAEMCSKINNDTKIESQVIFDRKLKSGQDPIILDEISLNSFFYSEDSRKLFETIVNGFQITD